MNDECGTSSHISFVYIKQDPCIKNCMKTFIGQTGTALDFGQRRELWAGGKRETASAQAGRGEIPGRLPPGAAQVRGVPSGCMQIKSKEGAN
ncbi:hypothetical protein [Ottowia sp. oral taxon 894]|uniref:hypothetical protein n=1 Tax=Ottowia sp. oral taxon 894 TaxID=1658672 RepID=UPI00155DD73C|nr:hypothetical protein [Ottowia sp. oral taxon 894]